MSRGDDRARGRLLATWEPPPDAGDPIGLLASTFTFDAGFFEEELLARFICFESSPDDAQAYLVEREERLGDITVSVLVDRRHVDRTKTLAWDLLGVPVPFGGCQHAKVNVLAWTDHIRLVVSSANMTAAAYRRNIEGFTVFDFREGGEVPGSLLEAFLGLLERMVRRVPAPVGEGPTDRALSLVETIRRQAAAMTLPDAWPRGAVPAHPVLLEPAMPGEPPTQLGPSVLERMNELWSGTLPDEVWICSPFWAEADDEGNEAVIPAVVAHMGSRGERRVHVVTRGEPAPGDGCWVAFVPDGVKRAESEIGRLEVDVRPVSARHDGDDARELHAKLIRWWRSSTGRDLLLIGSSNATGAGLGLASAGATRNIESNVCLEGNGDRKVERWFNACMPAGIEAERVELRRPDAALVAADEGGPATLPEFFAWAVVEREERAVELTVGFDRRKDEPTSWEIHVPGFAKRITSDCLDGERAPEKVVMELDLAESAAPDVLEVHWCVGDEERKGALSVNARGAASRCDRTIWAQIDLETMLAILAGSSGGSLWRRMVDAVRKQKRGSARGAARLDAEFDPHRRVNTSGFLVPRMRRISRALEGLGERLAAPVASEAGLDWRFDSPVGPIAFAKRLTESAADAGEKAFLLTEVLLTVARARRRVSSPSVEPERIEVRFRRTIDELTALVPRRPAGSSLESYLSRALEEARQ